MTERETADPRRIDTLAVHTDDVLTALETRERGGRRTVLRALPPFSGRMRARIHVVDGAGREDGALHIHPGAFVEDLPVYPSVDDTADELRERGEYDVAAHREHHADAVETWRETVRSRLRECIDLTFEGADTEEAAQQTLGVSYLG